MRRAQKEIINWRGSRLLYIFRVLVGKNIVKIRIGKNTLILSQLMKAKPKACVVLFTKPGCHLCEEMKQEMNKAGCSDLYELEEVNIEDDRDLFARYRYEIPVLSINGVEAFRYHLRADEFRSYVTALVSQ